MSEAPRSVSVLGLGDMGSALAHAFLAKQHTVTVWNRTASKASPLVRDGARAAESVDDAVASSDVTVVCLLDYAAGASLLQTPAVTKALEGKTVVQLTTGTPRDARDGAA